MGLEIDTKRLWGLLNELEPKRAAQSLRNGFRAAAREVRQKAVRNMLSSGLKGRTSEVAKGIRPVVYRKIVGFKVTVGTKKQKAADYSGMTSAARNKAKAFRRLRIVPLWAEGGTDERHTSSRGLFRKGARRGAMPAFRFMEKTDRETEGGVDAIIDSNVTSAIENAVKKYGSKLE